MKYILRLLYNLFAIFHGSMCPNFILFELYYVFNYTVLVCLLLYNTVTFIVSIHHTLHMRNKAFHKPFPLRFSSKRAFHLTSIHADTYTPTLHHSHTHTLIPSEPRLLTISVINQQQQQENLHNLPAKKQSET